MKRSSILAFNILVSFFLYLTIVSNTTVSLGQDNVSKSEYVVTYIANEGFLVSTENHKFLFDALFGGIEGDWCEQPSDSVINLMMEGTSLFNNIDLVFVSHKHVDHFDPQIAADFLLNHSESSLVCPAQADELLKSNPNYKDFSDRVISLNCPPKYDTSFTVNNVSIRAMRFNHGTYLETDSVTGETFDRHKNIDNMVYLIEADGINIFHSGDCSTSDSVHFKEYNLDKAKFDVTFFDRTFFNRAGQDLMNKYINAQNIVFVHIAKDKVDFFRSIIKDVPEMYIFKSPLESRKYVIKE